MFWAPGCWNWRKGWKASPEAKRAWRRLDLWWAREYFFAFFATLLCYQTSAFCSTQSSPSPSQVAMPNSIAPWLDLQEIHILHPSSSIIVHLYPAGGGGQLAVCLGRGTERGLLQNRWWGILRTNRKRLESEEKGPKLIKNPRASSEASRLHRFFGPEALVASWMRCNIRSPRRPITSSTAPRRVESSVKPGFSFQMERNPIGCWFFGCNLQLQHII